MEERLIFVRFDLCLWIIDNNGEKTVKNIQEETRRKRRERMI